MRRAPYWTGLILVSSGVLAGCKANQSDQKDRAAGSDQTGASATAPASVNVTATDFAFEAPATAPAGTTTIRLVNNGKELHQAQLVKLEDGKTMADLAKALKNPGPPPPWVKFVGGPNGIAPGQNAEATAKLAPGQYVYICLIPSPDGVIHAAKGMMRPFEVTESATASAPAEPKADVTIKLVDYDFQSSQPLKPGRQTIRVENAGPQAHELVLLRLAPGKKVEDFAHWAETGLKGPPPAEPLGGVGVLDKGGHGYFTADLTSGEYGLICFVPDSKDGKLHLAHGMMKTIKVG